jgi:hypothetical protein
VALAQRLGGPCYHMFEVLHHPDHIPHWQAAADGGEVDWDTLLAGYRATVDWPAGSFWREILAANPEAKVLLSVRPTDAWWRSADKTIWAVSRRTPPPDPVFQAQMAMVKTILERRFTPQWNEEGPSKEAYEKHNADVRASVPADQLIVWEPGDGWEPLCAGLGIPVPAEAFPHLNTTDEFRAMTHLDDAVDAWSATPEDVPH